MNGELLRLVDNIAREKNIDRETVFTGIENALLSASRKQYGPAAAIEANVDRMTGTMNVTVDGERVEPRSLGRIAAQAAKQVMIQRNREAERTSIFDEYVGRKGTIMSGQVSRIEHGNIIISLPRTEGFLPRSEQIPGETVHEADRIRALVLDVRETGSQVKVVLSRANPDFIRRLFELEVPEVADKIIDIKAIAREPGQRTKIAVTSIDTRVDAVGACVGIRGSRIKNIVDELSGEKIDIVRHNESSQVFIANALRPAEVEDIFLNPDIDRATVIVREDQLSLAIGKRGQNVRLAARLTGWDIDIMMEHEFRQQRDNAVALLAEVPGMDMEKAERMASMGFVSMSDLGQIDPKTLLRVPGLTPELAADIINFAREYSKMIATAQAEQDAAKAAQADEAVAEGAEEVEADGAEAAVAAEGAEAAEESEDEIGEEPQAAEEADEADESDAEQAEDDDRPQE